MIVVGGPHRADDRDIIDLPRQVWPPVADLDPTLAARGVTNLQRVHLRHEIAWDSGEVAYIRAIKRRLDDQIIEGGFVESLARVLIQSGFGIKALHVTRSTQHAEPDHTFCLRGKMRRSVRRRPRFGRVSAYDAVPMQHGSQ